MELSDEELGRGRVAGGETVLLTAGNKDMPFAVICREGAELVVSDSRFSEKMRIVSGDRYPVGRDMVPEDKAWREKVAREQVWLTWNGEGLQMRQAGANPTRIWKGAIGTRRSWRVKRGGLLGSL